MKKYKVGDVVWWANYGIKQVTKECPICFGKKEVTLILGNEDRVILPCQYCKNGYEAPTGIREEYKYVTEATLKTITSIKTNQNTQGEVVEYMSGNYYLPIEDIFDTKEDALIRSKAKAEEAQSERDKKIEYIKKDKQKSFSQNAGYWLQQIKIAEANIERYKKYARLCKARARK